MKKILCAFVLFGAAFTTSAQREMDLKVEILSPQNNGTVVYNEQFYLTVKVTNLGNENFGPADSLYIYMMINGDTLEYQLQQNINHTIRTGISINAGEDFTFQNAFAFSTGYLEATPEMCVGIMPVNGTDPIVEQAIGDNQSCIYVYVAEAAPTSGIGNVNKNEIVVSPNPVKDVLSLNVVPDNDHVKLVSMDGKQIDLKISNGSLNLSQIPNGVYRLSFDVKNEPYSTSIVVAK